MATAVQPSARLDWRLTWTILAASIVWCANCAMKLSRKGVNSGEGRNEDRQR